MSSFQPQNAGHVPNPGGRRAGLVIGHAPCSPSVSEPATRHLDRGKVVVRGGLACRDEANGRRGKRMAESGAGRCIVFTGGLGTAHMASRARVGGMQVVAMDRP
jgi:hypothetical protein